MRSFNGHNGLSITRRMFLRSGALTAAAVPTVSTLGLAARSSDTPSQRANQHAFEQNPNFLASAQGAALWIESAQKQDARGVYWLPEPDNPEKAVTVSAANAIYSGSAGTILFFIQLSNATGDPQYLKTAALGADCQDGSRSSARQDDAPQESQL